MILPWRNIWPQIHETAFIAPSADLIGDDVTIGHRVMVHGCTIQNRVLIGMGAILMDGCEIEDDCIVAAGSLVTEGKKFSSGSLIMGAPAKVVRKLTTEELAFLKRSANNYVGDSREYLAFCPGPEKAGVSNQDLEDPETELEP